jgi:N-acetylneuraminic acid mutarotase
MRVSIPVFLKIFLIPAMLFLCSCSSSNPAEQSVLAINNNEKPLPVWVSEWDSSGKPLTGEGLLGLFTIDIETNPLNVELNPTRTTSLVDSMEVIEITNFMSMFPCTTCIKLKSAEIDSDQNLVLTIGIKHPFPIGNPSLPPGGKNRADIHVFNVEGIMIFKGGSLGNMNFADSATTIAKNLVLNPSGYTGYLDPYLDNVLYTDATIHPYILHFDDYTAGNYMPALSQTGFLDVLNPSGNLVMRQGSGYDYKDYVLDVEIGLRYQFIFAVGCSYGVSTDKFTDRFIPQYRVPQYNKKAASEVHVTVTNNNLIEGIASSSATIQIDVLDMNHGVEVSAFINKMSADSSVSRILIEIPDILLQSLNIDAPTEISGDPRDPANPLRYSYAITNEKLAANGTYLGLVSVEDSFPPGANTHPYIAGRDGGFRVSPKSSPLTGLFNIDKFVTYQVFQIDVMPSMELTQISLMPNPAINAGAAVVNDIIYVVGGNEGLNATDPRSNTIDAFDPVTETWNVTPLAPMPTPRAGAAVEAVGNLIYVIGGQLDSGLGYTDVMEIYDTLTDSWSVGNPLPGAKRHGSGSAEKDGIIYIAGGVTIGPVYQNLFYRYDTSNNSWGALTNMNAPRTQFAMTLKGDYIYAVGGQPISGPGSEFTPYVEVYSITDMTWSVPTNTPSIKDFSAPPHNWLVGTAWENVGGDIILVSGAFDIDLLNDKVYLYDEFNEKFTEIGSVQIPRTLFASATWNDFIYIFGGIALSADDPPVPFMTPSVEKGG